MRMDSAKVVRKRKERMTRQNLRKGMIWVVGLRPFPTPGQPKRQVAANWAIEVKKPKSDGRISYGK